MNSKNQQIHSKAFTLIELLVVIAIVGLLASIVLVSLQAAAASARDGKRDAEVGEVNSVLRKTLEVYHNTNGNYPWDQDTEDEDGCCLEENTDIKNKLDPYLSAPLEDPLYSLAEPDSLDKHCYRYKTVNHGEDYKIRVNYETGGYKEVASWDGGGIVYWDCGDVLAYGGQDYATVLIGSQCWMAENLNVVTAQADKGDCSGYGSKYCYGDNSSNCDTYGGLYQWATMMCGEASSGSEPSGVQGICPTGWHIPSDDEWKTLEMNQGMSQATADLTGWRGDDEGSKLAGNATLWNSGALEDHANFGTSGFTALPAGYRTTSGTYGNHGGYTYIWSSLESIGSAWRRTLGYAHSDVHRSTYGKLYGFPARCIKD